jgi:DNA-binding SARP family transcriptional activator/Tfp pilus assembly protein PilF
VVVDHAGDVRLRAIVVRDGDNGGYRAVVQFRLLGPIEVHADDGSVHGLPRRQERALLAILLLEAGRTVSIDRLCELLWEDNEPDQARKAIRTLAARIRAMLIQAGSAHAAVRLVSDRGGYTLKVDPDAVDAHRFRTLLDRARQTADLCERDRLLREALTLWRGPALHNVVSEPLRQRLCAELDEQRLQAVEASIAAGLDLGRHEQLLPELARLGAEHPVRERLVELHMRALHHAGRTAEALELYRQARTRLADELGLDPGRPLRELHQAILQGDPEPLADTLPPQPPVRPTQLPPDVPGFTGREGELDELDALPAAPGQEGTAVVISAVSGTAGVGKTALAVHWAHRTAGRFPDGQLYVDLRGYDPDQPMLPGDALAGFLRALGVAGADIPYDIAERTARYRTLLATRRMLVLLDNASSVEQVRPLLPSSPTCLALVTSRDSLVGLVARHGARRIDVNLLPVDDAVALLRALIGPRVEAEPDATVALAEQCARLPLALRVAAELAATRRTATLTGLVDELADQQRRIRLLDAGGDHRTAIRAVFSWSYQHLPAEAARAFRLLGLHPGPDFDAYATAALTRSDTEHSRQVLDLLARAHLIEATGPGRFSMHDLLRAYAIDLATTDDAEQDRRSALTRLFDQLRTTAASAVEIMIPADWRNRPDTPPAEVPGPPLADTAAALAWLDTNRATIVAACAWAATHGWPHDAVRLAYAISRYLYSRSHHVDEVVVHTHTRRSAQDTGDQAAEAHALTSLAGIHWRQGRLKQAIDHNEQAVTLFRQSGDRVGEARALANLGIIQIQHGWYARAADNCRLALALFRETGNRIGEGFTLLNLGFVHWRQHRYPQATKQFRRALVIFRETGGTIGEACALSNLGLVDLSQGRDAEAEKHHGQALAILREIGDRNGEALTLSHLGRVYCRQGRLAEAAEHHRLALSKLREISDRTAETMALNALGETLHTAGQFDQARVAHSAALDLSATAGDRYEQARAHSGLAQNHQAAGHRDQAQYHWRQALSIFADLGLPDADDIRHRLAMSDRGGALGTAPWPNAGQI